MSHIAGVVPAAGSSTRMGAVKALFDAGQGRTFLERVAGTLARGGCAPVLVVMRESDGPEASLARRMGARVVVNPDPGEGPITSIRCALRALPREVVGILVLPVDHPLVKPATVEELLARFEAEPSLAHVPTYGGRRGHPVIVPQARFSELIDGALAEGLRTVLRRDPSLVREVPIDDPGVLTDIDTPEAYRRLLPVEAARRTQVPDPA